MKIKILYVIAALNAGGVENILFNYVKCFDRNKYSIDIACYSFYNGIYRKKFEELGCGILEIPSKKKFIRSWVALERVLKLGKYDIVHVHQDEKSMIPIVCAWLNNVPVRIVHAHNSDHGGALTILNRRISKLIFFCIANGYFACGKQVARDFYGDKYSEKNVFIMNNAIDSAKFMYDENAREKIREEYGISHDEILLGSIARLSNEKNHFFLIDIMKYLKKTSAKFKMIFWGDGPLKDELFTRIKQLSLENYIILAGAREDICKCYSALDLVVMPSLYEGMPITPLEALANGLQVVLSDCITREVGVTDDVHYLDLKDGPDKWANYIKDMNISRKKYINIGRYNLDEASKCVDLKYMELINDQLHK